MTVQTTAVTPLLTSTSDQLTQEDEVVDQRLLSSKRALSAAQNWSQVCPTHPSMIHWTLITFPSQLSSMFRHENPPIAQNTSPGPAAPHVPKDPTKDKGGISSESDDQHAPGQRPSSSTDKPRKQVWSKSTRGRNHSDLPQQYITPSNSRFNDFLLDVQYHYGLEPNPWGHLTMALVQHSRDKVFTGFQDTLTTKGAVFRNVHHNAHILPVPAGFYDLPSPSSNVVLGSWGLG